MGWRRIVGALLSAVVVMGLVTTEVASSAAAQQTLTGWLRVVAHDSRDGRTKVTYNLDIPGESFILKLPAVGNVPKKQRRAIRAALRANADKYVQITAKRKANGVYVAFGVTPIFAPPPPVEPPPLAPRPLKVAFVVVRWSDGGPNGIPDPNAVRQWALSDPASLAAYYRATSNNTIQISGAVMQITLPGGVANVRQDDGSTQTVKVSNTCVPFEQAVNQFKASPAFAQYAAYNHVMMLPQYTGPGNCGHAGSGNLRGRYTVLSGNVATNLRMYVAIGAHELGHNLGLLHAGILRCAAPPTDECLAPDSDAAQDIHVYGDPFDAMGSSSSLAQFSAVHKNSLGLLAPGAVVNVPKGTTTHTLRASDAPGLGGVRLLRVPRGNTEFTYNLEIRGPSAPWGPYRSSDAVANGISIRMTMAGQISDGATTYLVDRRNDTPSGYDAQWLAGQSFVDAPNGVRITVNSAAQGWATVTITR